jgi:hypothetical protein
LILFIHAINVALLAKFSDIVIAAVSSVISDECFQIPSPLAKDALDTATSMRSFFNNLENQPMLDQHSSLLFDKFSRCLNARYKRTSYQRERMWYKYGQLRISDEYRVFWEKFASESVGRVVHPIFYQYVGQTAFNSLIMEFYKYVPDESSIESSIVEMDLTYAEKNTLRYIGGSVCNNLRTKISRNSHPWKQSLLIAINDLAEDEPTQEESGDWVTLVDRGGLFRLNDVAWSLFQAMELMVREVFALENLKCINQEISSGLIDKILSDEEVLHYWQSLMIEVGREEGKLLLRMIIEAYVNIRGYSSAKLFMERYKLEHKESLQKQKSLRKTVQSKSQDD